MVESPIGATHQGEATVQAVLFRSRGEWAPSDKRCHEVALITQARDWAVRERNAPCDDPDAGPGPYLNSQDRR